MSAEPKLIRVESFDELRVGQAVWIKPYSCCGKSSGRTIVTGFEIGLKWLDEHLRIGATDVFKYAPQHVCKTMKYGATNFPVQGDLITAENVAEGVVFVEVIEASEAPAKKSVRV